MTVEAPERGLFNSHVAGNIVLSAYEVLNCTGAALALVANVLYGTRFIAHKTGVITAVGVFVVNSANNLDMAIYNTVVTTRARLWSAGSTAVGTAATWQFFAPMLAVTEGDHIDLAIAADNVTPTFGRGLAPTTAAAQQLAAPALNSPSGGGLNKLAWSIAASFPAPATLAEASLVTTTLIQPKTIMVIQ